MFIKTQYVCKLNALTRFSAYILCTMFILQGILVTAQERKKVVPKKNVPSIAITKIPSIPPGATGLDEISGRVTGAKEGDKVVIYSLGDGYYIQPFKNDFFTDITDNRWSADIHGGYEYVVFLVRKPDLNNLEKYATKLPAHIEVLPKIGGDILAMHRVRAKRK